MIWKGDVIKMTEKNSDYYKGKLSFVDDKRKDTSLDFSNTNLSNDFIKGYREAESDFNDKLEEYSLKLKDAPVYSLNELLDEVETTENINETIWLTPDNKMIWGEYDMGIRGTDHRNMLDIYDLDRDDTDSWNKIHEMGFVRVVSETKTALTFENQPFSNEQKETLRKGGFSVESYGTLEKNENNVTKKQNREKDDSLER